jgi:thioredoxin-related protein
MKKFVILSALILLSIGCKNSEKKSVSLNWLTVNEVSDLARQGEGKKVLIDVYTDWCHWCKVMDKNTFSDPKVIEFLSEHYHVVKFNAETRDPVSFKGKIYEWQEIGRNGCNSLAMELLQGRLSYPSIVYLDKTLNIKGISPGYKTPDQLLSELQNLN